MSAAPAATVHRVLPVALIGLLLLLLLLQNIHPSALPATIRPLAEPAVLGATAIVLLLFVFDLARVQSAVMTRFPDPDHYRAATRRLTTWSVGAYLLALFGTVALSLYLGVDWLIVLAPVAMIAILVLTVRASRQLQRSELARARPD